MTVFLQAKAVTLVDWAYANLPGIAALRVAQFVRTRNPKVLSTLTEWEMAELRRQNEHLGTRLKL